MTLLYNWPFLPNQPAFKVEQCCILILRRALSMNEFFSCICADYNVCYKCARTLCNNRHPLLLSDEWCSFNKRCEEPNWYTEVASLRKTLRHLLERRVHDGVCFAFVIAMNNNERTGFSTKVSSRRTDGRTDRHNWNATELLNWTKWGVLFCTQLVWRGRRWRLMMPPLVKFAGQKSKLFRRRSKVRFRSGIKEILE